MTTSDTLDKILEAIKLERAKNPKYGTALVINSDLLLRLVKNHSDLRDKLSGIDVLPSDVQDGFIVENWELTMEE